MLEVCHSVSLKTVRGGRLVVVVLMVRGLGRGVGDEGGGGV